MKLISWNINGYRAIIKKDFFEFIKREKPDILALQETKVMMDQLKENDYRIDGYKFELNPAERKGYSGVGVFFKEKPLNIKKEMGIKEYDSEGRFIQLEYEKFYFINVYFPNGKMNQKRLNYKLQFYETFLNYIEKLKKHGKAVILCGDVNTAHNEIDLARPKKNENTSGFLRIERDWLDKLVKYGWIDVFRYLYPDKITYSWWDFKTKARERNVGWRIDYFFIDKQHINYVKNCYYLTDIEGSDHCPVVLEIEI